MTPTASSICIGLMPGMLAMLACWAIFPWLSPRNFMPRVLALGAVTFLLLHYLAWRCFETLPPSSLTLEYGLGVLFLVIEVLSLTGGAMALIFLSRTRSRSQDVERNLPWLFAQESLPQVDVLICTYNEDATILQRTIMGALATGYPKVRVWVCDDGRREWLRALCEKFACGYLTRPDNHHAKAGNINHALSHLAQLPEPPDFVAILDADFVALPQFIPRALSLFREADVGVVQTPQHFVNPDPIQSNLSIARCWPDEQRFFFDVVMASKDAWGAAFCCGTSSILRFSALMQISGFPTDSVTEDYLVSLRLRQRGWRTVYLNECLSLGLAPEGLAEYITQRSRWCLGFVQICRGPNGPWRPLNGLSIADRMILTETFLYWSATHAFRMMGLVVPSLYLLFDVHIVDSPLQDALEHFVPFFVVQIATMRWLTGGRVLPGMSDVSQMMAANEILRAVAAGLLRPKGQKFKVTAKGGDRTRRLVQWPVLRLFLALLALNVAGIVYPFVIDSNRSILDSSAMALMWSWYNILILLIACFVCVEQPRLRRHERFKVREVAHLHIDGRVLAVEIDGVSQGGACVMGAAPAVVGRKVMLEIQGFRLSGQIARITERYFAVEFADDAQTTQMAFSLVYSGRYSMAIDKINAPSVYGHVLSRIFK
jgi:cellulose synthase (UDP-forming)